MVTAKHSHFWLSLPLCVQNLSSYLLWPSNTYHRGGIEHYIVCVSSWAHELTFSQKLDWAPIEHAFCNNSYVCNSYSELERQFPVARAWIATSLSSPHLCMNIRLYCFRQHFQVPTEYPSQLLLYRTLGYYTGVRAHTGPPRISVPRRNSSQYVLYTVWYSDIPDFLYTGL